MRDGARLFKRGFCKVLPFGAMLAVAAALAVASNPAAAQSINPPNGGGTPPSEAPLPPPLPTVTDVNATMSAGMALTGLGSSFLQRLGNQATYGFNAAYRNNPGGGGASASTELERYRTWGELYGLSARTNAQADFVGDRRRTFGGVAGFGVRVTPGFNVGVSIDQSHTGIDVPLALQSATLDLTQIGITATLDKGPWTWATAAVHGFGNINSSRDTGFGLAKAGYNGRVDGLLSEISYFWGLDQSRIVPKAAFEYVRTTTGSLQEFGGLDPIVASGATAERARFLVGAEVGHYWIFHGKVLDLSAYGKFVDNVSQTFDPITVSLGLQSITVQGIGESRYGADVGASASLFLSNAARVYVNYDGRLRAAAQSHQGTLGVEFKW